MDAAHQARAGDLADQRRFSQAAVHEMRIPALYDRLWPVGQRAIGVSEYALDKAMLYDPHDYAIDWREDGVTFSVDGMTVHQSPHSPRGKRRMGG